MSREHRGWRVVATSNFNDESFNEYFFDDVERSMEDAIALASMLNDQLDLSDPVFWQEKPKDYKLHEWLP